MTAKQATQKMYSLQRQIKNLERAAYTAGYRAAKRGGVATDNPYPREQRTLWLEWLKGWREEVLKIPLGDPAKK